MEETVIPNFRGGEKEFITKMYTDDKNKIMRGKLKPGASIGFHCHDDGSEIVFVLSGTAKALYDDGEEALKAGICHYCPKGHSHSIINTGEEDFLFFAVVACQ